MKQKISLVLIFLLFAFHAKAQMDSIFVGTICNKEFNVYFSINFNANNIIVPGQAFLGEVPGFFGDYTDARKWLITKAKRMDKNVVELQMVNDYGSEDLIATLTYNADTTFTFKQVDGSSLKIARKRKWVKLPKQLIFTRKNK